MSRYDGLIIPRSYNEYINKTDAATLQQALQLSGVLSGAVAASDNKAVTSNAVYEALTNLNYFHKNTINYGLKIKILEKLSEKGQFFNAIFSWSSYGRGNYISIYSLRFTSTEISNLFRIAGIATEYTGSFKIENDDLYFYPNGETEIFGVGGSYILLLS